MTEAECGFCGESVSVWPRRSCETPLEHVDAAYECDCGDLVLITAELGRHRRCHLIGVRDAGLSVVGALLLGCVLIPLLLLAVVKGGERVMCGQDPTIAYCAEAGR